MCFSAPFFIFSMNFYPLFPYFLSVYLSWRGERTVRIRKVKGSNPSVSTNKNATTKVVAFLLGFGPAERPSAPFYHLTAEMNSAYDNSPLRSELARHSARPPEGGIYSVSMLHVVADFISFATTFYFKKSSLIHSVAPPFQIEPAALGFDLG